VFAFHLSLGIFCYAFDITFLTFVACSTRQVPAPVVESHV
jgi:hypothetical protein